MLRGFGKHLAGGGDAVERRGKSRVDCHLLENLHDLLARVAGRQRRAQMILERRRLRADRVILASVANREISAKCMKLLPPILYSGHVPAPLLPFEIDFEIMFEVVSSAA